VFSNDDDDVCYEGVCYGSFHFIRPWAGEWFVGSELPSLAGWCGVVLHCCRRCRGFSLLFHFLPLSVSASTG